MISKKLAVCALFLLALLFLLNGDAAAQSAGSLTINYIDTTNFPEVRVYVTVTDAQNSPVTGLDKGTFSLFEGGAPATIDNLSNQVDQMFLVLMLDTTGSMLDPDPSGRKPIDILKDAATKFVQTLAPQDVVSVYTFDEQTNLLLDFTTDRQKILDSINGINIAVRRNTALWDASFTAVTKAAEIPRGRRAVVVFTDGEDNASKTSNLDDVINKAKESQIPVYTIAAGSEIKTADLGRLSFQTGAQSLTSQLSAEIPNLFASLSSQLKSQYVLVYTSNAPEGRIDLKVQATYKGISQAATINFPVPSVQATIAPLVTLADSSQFPQNKIYVSVPTFPIGVPITPTLDNFLVQEDGSRVNPAALDTVRRGATIQILLDTRTDLSQKGATQRSLWLEEREALLELSGSDRWLDKSGSRDLVSVIASRNDPARPNFPPASDYNLLNNFAYSDKIPPSDPLPFDQLLRQGIDSINSVPSDGRRATMLIFSNGIPSTVDSGRLQDAADSVRNNNISVFVIYFGSSEKTAEARNLKDTASRANWRYYWYTSLASIQSVYQQLIGFSKQYAITYRSKVSTSGDHLVRVAVRRADQSQVDVFTDSHYNITLAPPQIAVVLSTPGGLVRKGDTWDTPISQTVPASMPISYTVTWPDSHPRTLDKFSYTVDKGPEMTVASPPSDTGTVDLNVTDLGEGNHSLEIIAQDELGLNSAPTDINVPINLEYPPAPLPIQIYRLAGAYLPYVALVASAILLVAAFVTYRKSQTVRTFVTTTVKSATEFFVRPRGERKPAKAYLVGINGEDASRGSLEIRGETTRLGRDDSVANIVLQDPTVSKLHAKIVEEQDGAFRIYDEGSRSGTFLNDEEVGMGGQWIRDGDTIALGKDEFKFKLKLGPKEDTEIYKRADREGKEESTDENEDTDETTLNLSRTSEVPRDDGAGEEE
ncbi:VWA domain-containing protein [Petrachloros mirabilis]